MVEYNSGMVGGASLLNELAAKCAVLGALFVDFKRIFNFLKG